MKKIIVLVAGAILLCSSVFTFIYVKNENGSVNDLLAANVDALADNESSGVLDTNYKNKKDECIVKLSAGTKIEIFGVGIITAKADGEISIAGRIVCESKGNETCRPVECSDLYSVILHGGER